MQIHLFVTIVRPVLFNRTFCHDGLFSMWSSGRLRICEWVDLVFPSLISTKKRLRIACAWSLFTALSYVCVCQCRYTHTLLPMSCIVSEVLVTVFTEAGTPAEAPGGTLVTAKSSGSIRKWQAPKSEANESDRSVVWHGVDRPPLCLFLPRFLFTYSAQLKF